jgi:hypothetical protein
VHRFALTRSRCTASGTRERAVQAKGGNGLEDYCQRPAADQGRAELVAQMNKEILYAQPRGPHVVGRAADQFRSVFASEPVVVGGEGFAGTVTAGLVRVSSCMLVAKTITPAMMNRAKPLSTQTM